MISAALVIFLVLTDHHVLTEQWISIAKEDTGRIGISILILESGQTAAMNGSDHFPMQSVYKLPIAMAVLHRVDQGELSLEQILTIRPDEYIPANKHSPLRDQFPSGSRKTVRELIRYSLVESDGTASDVLLRLAGGPARVNHYLRSLGIRELVVANSEMDMTWYTQFDDWCTPRAALQLLGIIQKGPAISESSRTVLLSAMQESQTGENRIRHLLPKGTVVADKTGSSGTQNGRAAATNDIGLVTLPDGRHLAIAIFVTDSEKPEELRDQEIAKLARAAWDEFVQQNP